MKRRKRFETVAGNLIIKIESIDDDAGLHDYGLPRRTWLRAVRFANHFGHEHALELIDQRAERAAERLDFETARRWRELITAIHAMMEEEKLPGDKTH